jgi:hypothetical protein
MPTDLESTRRPSSAGLVDLLDRILDKGLVIAGDIKISLAEVELLTIRVRLLVCSVDKAMQIGLDWWKHDKHLSGTGKGLIQENEALREQVQRLEQKLAEQRIVRPRLAGAPKKARPKGLRRTSTPAAARRSRTR